jgi:hypothetical protein
MTAGQSQGLTEALRALGLPRGPAEDDERPRRVSTLPGPVVKPLPGQLVLGQELPDEPAHERGEAA